MPITCDIIEIWNVRVRSYCHSINAATHAQFRRVCKRFSAAVDAIVVATKSVSVVNLLNDALTILPRAL